MCLPPRPPYGGETNDPDRPSRVLAVPAEARFCTLAPFGSRPAASPHHPDEGSAHEGPWRETRQGQDRCIRAEIHSHRGHRHLADRTIPAWGLCRSSSEVGLPHHRQRESSSAPRVAPMPDRNTNRQTTARDALINFLHYHYHYYCLVRSDSTIRQTAACRAVLSGKSSQGPISR